MLLPLELTNHSAFRVRWKGIDFDTAEHAYQWEKFASNPGKPEASPGVQRQIREARSAHDAFKIARANEDFVNPVWPAIRMARMKHILFDKMCQHEYVRQKLLATGTKELIEDSWRDDYWGWGPNKDGQNMLGKLWMDIRWQLTHPPGDENKQVADKEAA